MRGLDREVESLGQSAEDRFSSAIQNVRGRAAKVANADRHSSLSPENKKFVDSFKGKVSQELEKIGEGEEAAKSRAKEVAKKIASSAAKADKEGNAEKAKKSETPKKSGTAKKPETLQESETAQEPEIVQDVENPETAQEVAEAEKAKVGNAKMVTEETSTDQA
jgi:hypothetical protein